MNTWRVNNKNFDKARTHHTAIGTGFIPAAKE
jgi:hypothetical protein